MFKCRASSLHKLMTNSRVKSQPLSDTAKGVIRDFYLENQYGYRKFTGNKYTAKGLQLEDLAISTLSDYLFLNLFKNQTRITDEYFTGECDILLDDSIRDVKCVWSLDTMPLTQDEAEKKVKKGGYDWQGQCYMHLYDRDVHYVDFILLPTPTDLLKHDDEYYYHSEEFVNQIPLHKRIKTVKIERDNTKIEQAIQRVKDSQDYYLELLND